MKNRLGDVIRSTRLTRLLIVVAYFLTIYLGVLYCVNNKLNTLSIAIILIIITIIYALALISDFIKRSHHKQIYSVAKLIEKKLKDNPWEVYLKLLESNSFVLKKDMIAKTDSDTEKLTTQFMKLEEIILDNVSNIEQNIGTLTVNQKQESASCIDQLTDTIKKNAWYVRSGLEKSMTALTTANEKKRTDDNADLIRNINEAEYDNTFRTLVTLQKLKADMVSLQNMIEQNHSAISEKIK